jgi:predicted branched-subunit amino acid permease
MAGNLLPVRAVSALGVALYGMFLAVIIPPAKKDHRVLVIVVLSFLASYASEILPWISGLYGSTRIILLTIVLAGLAALVFPVREPDPVQDSEADPITGSASDSGKEPDTHA